MDRFDSSKANFWGVLKNLLKNLASFVFTSITLIPPKVTGNEKSNKDKV